MRVLCQAGRPTRSGPRSKVVSCSSWRARGPRERLRVFSPTSDGYFRPNAYRQGTVFRYPVALPVELSTRQVQIVTSTATWNRLAPPIRYPTEPIEPSSALAGVHLQDT